MDETEARIIANEWLRKNYHHIEMITGIATETKRSWLFIVEAEDHEPLLGHVTVAVSKLTGVVFKPSKAWMEFYSANDLTMISRLQRWWYRRYY